MTDDCRHVFDMITYDQTGNMCPTTKCIRCGEGFIIEERKYNEIFCIRMLRGPYEKYDYFTGALVVESK